MEEKCKLCKFWKFYLTQEFSDKPDIDIGHCRRYPKVFRTESCYPRPTIIECPENKTGVRSVLEYPEHMEDDWCGEFKLKDEEEVCENQYSHAGMVADMLGVKRCTLTGWANKGKIPYLPLPDGKKSFSYNEIVRHLKKAARTVSERKDNGQT